MKNIYEIKEISASWADPVLPPETARSLLATPHHTLLAIGQDSEKAYIFGQIAPHSPADILSLFTHPAQRRKGYAHALLKAFINKAKSAHCPAVTLEVRASNAAARALYESLQFQKLAVRPGYYAAPQEDAVVYSLNLG